MKDINLKMQQELFKMEADRTKKRMDGKNANRTFAVYAESKKENSILNPDSSRMDHLRNRHNLQSTDLLARNHHRKMPGIHILRILTLFRNVNSLYYHGVNWRIQYANLILYQSNL